MLPKEFRRSLKDATLQLEAEIEGYCPVQGHGKIAGVEFYFRARWEEWTFALATGEMLDPIDISSSGQGFFREGRYGQKPYDASWMPLEEAERIIRECARQFLDTKTK